MSILSRYRKLLTSDVSKLTLDGKIVALRLKLYDIDVDNFLYFDFYTSFVKDNELQSFLRTNTSQFPELPLCVKRVEHDKEAGVDRVLYLTKEEAENNLVIQEFKETSEAEAYLRLIKKIYSWKGDGIGD